MSTQKTASKAVVWGNNIGVAYTDMTKTENLNQSTTYTREADEQEIRDADGEVVNLTIYNARNTIDIEVIPIGATLVAAKANNVSPAYGEQVVITDESSGGHTQVPGAHSGYYICVGATQTSTNTGEVRISMSLRAYSTDISANATTGP